MDGKSHSAMLSVTFHWACAEAGDQGCLSLVELALAGAAECGAGLTFATTDLRGSDCARLVQQRGGHDLGLLLPPAPPFAAARRSWLHEQLSEQCRATGCQCIVANAHVDGENVLGAHADLLAKYRVGVVCQAVESVTSGWLARLFRRGTDSKSDTSATPLRFGVRRVAAESVTLAQATARIQSLSRGGNRASSRHLLVELPSSRETVAAAEGQLQKLFSTLRQASARRELTVESILASVRRQVTGTSKTPSQSILRQRAA